MGSFPRFTLGFLIASCIFYQCSAFEVDSNQTARLLVNSSEASARKIPETLFGIFFEEINHAGAGGLWAELVNNRGFEAGGQNIPSNIDPWSIVGDGSSLLVATDRSSCFDRNKIALRMEVLCDSQGTNVCPVGGVGVYNPGFWGMVKVVSSFRRMAPSPFPFIYVAWKLVKTCHIHVWHDIFATLAKL